MKTNRSLHGPRLGEAAYPARATASLTACCTRAAIPVAILCQLYHVEENAPGT